jgi:hypothetical protein
MKISESRIELAAKFYEIRRTARELFGESYAQKIVDVKPIILAAMVKLGTDNHVDAVADIIKGMTKRGEMSAGWMLRITSAMLDLIEEEGGER